MKAHSLEPLEQRIAPAALFTYVDVDGDVVTVASSVGNNADLHNAAKFIGGTQLKTLDLSKATFGGEFQGADLSITARPGPTGGDGHVNVGYINAIGHDLHSVRVAGDLGAIDVGDDVPTTPALGALQVGSFGLLGTFSGAPDLESDIIGPLGSLTVKSSINEAYLFVTGKIGPVTIGGSIRGGAAMHSGSIEGGGDIGPVKIGGSILGGGEMAGYVKAGGALASLTVGGEVLGSAGQYSGAVVAQSIGPVSIGETLSGGGFSPFFVGLIQSTSGDIGSVKIGGSLKGGFGGGFNGLNGVKPSGGIMSAGNIGAVTITGSVLGGMGIGSGTITATGDLASLTVGGDVLGKASVSGSILISGTIGAVKIGGNLQGGDTATNGVSDSGVIDSHGKITSVKIGGSLIGTAAGSLAGLVRSAEAIGPVTIGGSIVGSTMSNTGEVTAPQVTSLRLGGNLTLGTGSEAGELRVSVGGLEKLSIGGAADGVISIATSLTSLKAAGDFTGRLTVGQDLTSAVFRASMGGNIQAGSIGLMTIGNALLGVVSTTTGDIGSITVRTDLSGEIFSNGKITSTKIGGSLLGGDTPGRGSIFAADNIGLVQVRGDVRGGNAMETGVIHAESALPRNPSIHRVAIRGSILFGNGNDSGDVFAEGNLDSVAVGGDIFGGASKNVTFDSGYVRAQGNIGALTVGRDVYYARILAGYSNTLVAFNGDAQIGAVKVGRDWIASDLVAGIKNVNYPKFGDANDVSIGVGDPLVLATIATITIGGQVFGTLPNIADEFGFVAQKIGSLQVGATIIKLTAGKDNLNVGSTADTTLHEV